jgi:hypothetical protein
MRLGLDRAKYVRSLIEDDLSGARGRTPRVFASEDLVGLYQGDTGPATNASARGRLRARVAARRRRKLTIPASSWPFSTATTRSTPGRPRPFACRHRFSPATRFSPRRAPHGPLRVSRFRRTTEGKRLIPQKRAPCGVALQPIVFDGRCRAGRAFGASVRSKMVGSARRSGPKLQARMRRLRETGAASPREWDGTTEAQGGAEEAHRRWPEGCSGQGAEGKGKSRRADKRKKKGSHGDTAATARHSARERPSKKPTGGMTSVSSDI